MKMPLFPGRLQRPVRERHRKKKSSIAMATSGEDADEHERMVEFREFGYAYIMKMFHDITDRFGNHFERWQSEREMYLPSDEFDGKSPFEVLHRQSEGQGRHLREGWRCVVQVVQYGDEKDRVVRKADGDYTYFASDVAYHYWKKERGFDILIDIWGADHHGYIARVAAVLAAMGFPGALEVMLGQLVNLFRDGKPVRMSKRTGEMIAFEELIDEVGIDATRYYMLSRSTEQPIDFDIDVAKKQDSSNPVYYVQYAHARICKLLRDEAGHSGEDNLDMAAVASEAIPADVDLSVLTAPEELALMRKMSEFGDLIALAARDRAPFRLTHYAQDLASLFHQFYTNCKILKADDEGPEEGSPCSVRRGSRCARADARHSGHFRPAAHVAAANIQQSTRKGPCRVLPLWARFL